MSAETMPLPLARGRLLDQYLVACPGCAKPAAAHVGQHPDGTPMLVRLVCPVGCAVAADDVLAALSPVEVSLTA
jgi:hypothetical protein